MRDLLITYFKKTFPLMLFILTVQVISNLLSITVPLSYQYLIDTILAKEQYGELKGYAMFVISIFSGYLLLNFASQKMVISYMNNLESLIKEKIFSRVLHLESSTMNHFTKGQIITRISADVNAVITVLAEYLFSTFMSLISYLVVITIIFKMNVTIGIFCIILTPVYFIISHYFGAWIKKYNLLLKSDSEQFIDIVDEAIEGRETIRVYKCQEYQRRRFISRLKSYIKHKRKLMIISVLSKQSFQGLSILFPVVILLIGASLIMRGSIQLGTLISVLSCMNYVLAPSTTLSKALIAMKEYKVAFYRLRELYECKNDIYPNQVNSKKDENYISFNDIHIQFPSQELFKGVSFSMNQHEIISIIGANGVGKSSLAKMLAGLIVPQRGEIRVDGEPLNEDSLQGIRDKISIALQHNFLFSDTVYNNIYLGKEKLPKNTEAIEFLIEEIGYNKFVHRHHMNLSGGEIQKIILARVLAKDGEILILDETISNIDLATSREIREVIYAFKGKKTILIVDHQLSFMDISDRVIFIQNKEKIHIDTHQNLLVSNAAYRQMFLQEQDRVACS